MKPQRYAFTWLHVLLAVAVAGMAIACSGCADMVTYYKVDATAANTATTGYTVLDRVDEQKKAEIKAHIATSPDHGKAEKAAWEDVFGKARKAIVVLEDTSRTMLREGPSVEALHDNRKQASLWITAATTAIAGAAQAFQDAGINWQDVLAKLGGK
jgi:hypothetical protein